MLIFVHLFVGAVIGIAIAQAIRDNRAIYACILGSGISDFIDKPIGLIYPALDTGRTFFHTLLIFGVFVIAGIMLWKYRQNFIVIVMAIGIFLHQITDRMWEVPGWWFFPFGKTEAGHFIDPAYFGNFFMIEVESLSEWIFFIIIAIIVYDQLYKKQEELWRLILSMGGVMCMGAFSVLCWYTNTPCIFTPVVQDQYGNLIVGIIAILGGLIYLIIILTKQAGSPPAKAGG